MPNNVRGERPYVTEALSQGNVDYAENLIRNIDTSTSNPTARKKIEKLHADLSQLEIGFLDGLFQIYLEHDPSANLINPLKRMEHFAQTQGTKLPRDFSELRRLAYQREVKRNYLSTIHALGSGDAGLAEYSVIMIKKY